MRADLQGAVRTAQAEVISRIAAVAIRPLKRTLTERCGPEAQAPAGSTGGSAKRR
jgi:hypothetical protein